MCPACIATMTFLVAGSASTGGLTALATKKFRRKAVRKQSPAMHRKPEPMMTKIETEQAKTGFAEVTGQNELSKDTGSRCGTSAG
jgi:hypothetical protein